MSLSLFLKRRKADLLQNIWEQSSEENTEKVRINSIGYYVNFIVKNKSCIKLLNVFLATRITHIDLKSESKN